MINYSIKPIKHGKRTKKVCRSGESQKRFGHRNSTTSKNKIKDVPIKYGYHLEDYNRHVVYEHYYDNEELPFYVGEGTLQRAFVLCGNRRTSYYNEKAKDINLIKVKIVAIDVSNEEALEIETNLINKYGKISEGGSLVNMDYKRGGGRRESIEKKVYQFDKNGNFIKCYNSITEAEKDTNIKLCNISLCAKGHPNHKTAGGFVWRFSNNFELLDRQYTTRKHINPLLNKNSIKI